jgi:hypothetical protein
MKNDGAASRSWLAGLQGTILHFLLAICVIFQAAERLLSSSLKIYYAWIIGKCSVEAALSR